LRFGIIENNRRKEREDALARRAARSRPVGAMRGEDDDEEEKDSRIFYDYVDDIKK